VAVDLLPDPGMHNPVLQFGNGGVANNEGTVFPGTSPTSVNGVGYTDYGWWVTQWGKYSTDNPPIPYYLTPTSYVQNDPSTLDPNFGVAPLIFYSENDPSISHVALYQDNVLNNWVYELWAQDGVLTAGGGTDLFLANNPGTGYPTLDLGSAVLDSDVRLTFSTKVKSRILEYDNQAAETNGSVLAQYFVGFSLWYTDPATGIPYGQFLQIPLANTWESTATDEICMGVGANNVPEVEWSGVQPGNEFLSSTPSTGGLQTMEFDVNQNICSLVQAVYNCAGVGGGTNVGFPPAAFDLKNWQVVGFYMGLETENELASDTAPEGHAGMGVQIEDLHLYKFPAIQGPSCAQ